MKYSRHFCIVLLGALIAPGLPAVGAPVLFEPAPRQVLKGKDPQIAVRASGQLFLIETKAGDVWLHSSIDGGDTFDEGVRINAAPGEVRSHPEAQPQLRVRSMREFYVLWQTEADGMNQLRFARSMDWGHTFSRPIAVDPAGPASRSFATMEVAPDGTVYVAWLDGRDRAKSRAGGSAVYIARSKDRGETFEPSVRVGLNVCPCCRPAIAFGAGKTVHVSWRALFDNDVRDFVVGTSADGGATWGEAVRVAEDGWSINGCPHSGASMAVLNGRLYVSWFTVREKRSEVYLATSTDGGGSFSARQSVSEELLDPNHPALFDAGGRVAVLFQARDPQTNNGWGKVAAYYREVDAKGSLSPMVRIGQLSGSATYPAMTWEDPDRLFAVWSESTNDGPIVVLSRGRRAAEPVMRSSAGENRDGR